MKSHTWLEVTPSLRTRIYMMFIWRLWYSFTLKCISRSYFYIFFYIFQLRLGLIIEVKHSKNSQENYTKSVFQLIWIMFTLDFIVEFRFKDLRFFQSFFVSSKNFNPKFQRCHILFTLTHLMQVKQHIFFSLCSIIGLWTDDENNSHFEQQAAVTTEL